MRNLIDILDFSTEELDGLISVANDIIADPDKYREVIILHYYQSLPTPEVAMVLHIPQASVRTRLHRARKLLEPLLKGWYLNDE